MNARESIQIRPVPIIAELFLTVSKGISAGASLQSPRGHRMGISLIWCRVIVTGQIYSRPIRENPWEFL